MDDLKARVAELEKQQKETQDAINAIKDKLGITDGDAEAPQDSVATEEVAEEPVADTAALDAEVDKAKKKGWDIGMKYKSHTGKWSTVKSFELSKKNSNLAVRSEGGGLSMIKSCTLATSMKHQVKVDGSIFGAEATSDGGVQIGCMKFNKEMVDAFLSVNNVQALKSTVAEIAGKKAPKKASK